MNMTDAVKSVFNNYATFTGRAARPEYWWFFLFNIVAGLVLGLLQMVLFQTQMGQLGVLTGLYSLAVIIPGIAVSVRRMHDVARSGWWLLIGLVPLIGAIVLIYWFVQRGTVGPNDFGADPTT